MSFNFLPLALLSAGYLSNIFNFDNDIWISLSFNNLLPSLIFSIFFLSHHIIDFIYIYIYSLSRCIIDIWISKYIYHLTLSLGLRLWWSILVLINIISMFRSYCLQLISNKITNHYFNIKLIELEGNGVSLSGEWRLWQRFSLCNWFFIILCN